MVKVITPPCQFEMKLPDFNLIGVDGTLWNPTNCRGATGLLVMFISNQCPFVQIIRSQLIFDVHELFSMGIGVVAINPNSTSSNQQESFHAMRATAKKYNYNFPYLVDSTQEISSTFGAYCTPDFFGFNASMELQYRGRLCGMESGETIANEKELLTAMREIAISGQGPKIQHPSTGRAIDWSISTKECHEQVIRAPVQKNQKLF